MKPAPIYRDTNLQIVFCITLMAMLGVASISPILPQVAAELDISQNQVGLLITAFTLPGIILTPVFGIVSDRVGRRKVLVPSLLLFGVAGAAVAAAPEFETMMALRFLQGVGAAALGTINFVMIGDLYSGDDRIQAMGYNSTVLSIASGSYPALGGALATFDWRYPFLLPILAVPVALLVAFKLRNPEPHGNSDMRRYFADLGRVVRGRMVLGLLAATLVTFVILYGARVTYLPILMESSFGATPLATGLILSCAPLATAVVGSQLGRIRRLGSVRHLIAIAFGLYAVALVLVPVTPTLYLLILPTLIFGVAQGLNLPNVFALLTGAVESDSRGALLALNGMLLRTGQTIGPLLMGLLAAVVSVDGAFFALAILPVCMAAAALITIRPQTEAASSRHREPGATHP